MKISTEPIENSQVAMNVEVERAELDRYLEKAYKHLVEKVSIPGFRKGRAPRSVLETHVGKDALFQEALEHLIPEIYEEAIENQSIEAIAQPKIELIKTEPVVFKAVVPVKPKIKLGDYKEIKLQPDKAEVGDKEIESTIELVRRQYAVLTPVERSIRFGDIITIDIEGIKEGKPFLNRKGALYEVIEDSLLPLPGFSKEIIGLSKGDEKKFTLSYPSDYKVKELAEKEYSLFVKVLEVKQRELPEISDEFAKNAGSNDLSELREKIKGNLKIRAEEKLRVDFEQKLIDMATDLSELEFPPILIDQEIDRLVNEEVRNFSEGIKGLENYLNSINKTFENHLDDLKATAAKRVRQSLILGKIAEAENINVADKEINEEIEKMIKDDEKRSDDIRKLFTLTQAKESLRQLLVTRKTIDRLTHLASGSD